MEGYYTLERHGTKRTTVQGAASSNRCTNMSGFSLNITKTTLSCMLSHFQQTYCYRIQQQCRVWLLWRCCTHGTGKCWVQWDHYAWLDYEVLDEAGSNKTRKLYCLFLDYFSVHQKEQRLKKRSRGVKQRCSTYRRGTGDGCWFIKLLRSYFGTRLMIG